ncbi:MAG: hypothetical protein WC679_01145 [Bacteroidales bacterium]|jgi:hypothetical protein
MILRGEEYDDILPRKELYKSIDDYTLRYFNYKVGYRNIPGFVYADLDTEVNQLIVYVLKSRCNISISMQQYRSSIAYELDTIQDTSIKQKTYQIQYRYLKHEKIQNNRDKIYVMG